MGRGWLELPGPVRAWEVASPTATTRYATGRKVSGEAAFQSGAQTEGASSSSCPGRSHS